MTERQPDQVSSPEPAASPLALQLGLGRAVVLHVDDLGMCHGSNAAFLELAASGFVTCGSVMVPCPWFREIAEAGAADPSLDIGVHLTLTSEWEHYRWSPISTRSRASGLIDPDGYFWRNVEQLRRHLEVEAAEAELRAQIEQALAAGLRPTHIDAHMAAAMLPELLPCHLALAREYGLVPVLPRRIGFAPDPELYERAIVAIEESGLLLPDGIRGTLPVEADATRAGYRRMFETLPAGVTHVALHCTKPGEIEAIAPAHAGWRTREYALFAEGAVRGWCREGGIAAIGYRALQPLWPVC
ncbi:polysaccharide deacetylase family protein [Muricoccus radiodurans]|uniref:polysaccharide deacetylase family protein n=1 Tax=Muricoccus radiodurans TaxID=2231721 RepID=UPI003CED8F9A